MCNRIAVFSSICHFSREMRAATPRVSPNLRLKNCITLPHFIPMKIQYSLIIIISRTRTTNLKIATIWRLDFFLKLFYVSIFLEFCQNFLYNLKFWKSSLLLSIIDNFRALQLVYYWNILGNFWQLSKIFTTRWAIWAYLGLFLSFWTPFTTLNSLFAIFKMSYNFYWFEAIFLAFDILTIWADSINFWSFLPRKCQKSIEKVQKNRW